MRLRTLKAKTMLLVAGLVMACGTLVAVVITQHFSGTLLETMRAQAMRTAQNLALQATDKVLINDLVAVQGLLEQYQRSNPSIGYLFVTRDQRVLGHTFPKGVPVGLLDDLPSPPDQEPLMRPIVSTDGERFLDVAWPIMVVKAGVLRLGLKEAPYTDKLHHIWSEIAVMTLVVLALSLGLCLMVVRRLSQPLDTLVRATEQLGKGDWGARVEVSSGLGELEALSAAFNQMVDRLADKNRRLEQQAQDLKRAHSQASASCNLAQEISPLGTSWEIASVLLLRLREMLPCRQLFILTMDMEGETLWAHSPEGYRSWSPGQETVWGTQLLAGLGERGFLEAGQAPSGILPPTLPNDERLSALPITAGGRTLGALLVSCLEGGQCEHCDLGFAEMILHQASGTLLRVISHEDELRRLSHPEEVHEGLDEMVGKDASMQSVFRLIQEVAPTDSTVLITGESGTGKELAARAIHRLSQRRDKPFVVIDCSAYPATLLESELFGYEKGAFTGATRQKPGRFEQAQGGTVFLDEVGEIPLPAQTKLLRVLQTHKFERLGGTKTLDLDLRILAATNKNLLAEVKSGSFREDLYYRLSVFPLEVPPLRQRHLDILRLARHFLRKFNKELGKGVIEFSQDALRLLLDYQWPGNVRELENVVERALVLAKGVEVEAWDLPDGLRDTAHRPDMAGTLETHERQALVKALEQSSWNKKLAADRLGISRTTLYRKIKQHNLGQTTRH